MIIKETIKIDKIIDTRAKYCPELLLAARIAFIDLKTNQILEIISSTKKCKIDIPKWSKSKGHKYLGYKEEFGYYKFYIKKYEK